MYSKTLRINIILFGLLFIGISQGCIYYTFQSGSLTNLKTIVIKPVKNNTLQYGLESTVESALKSGFVQDGRLSLVNNGGDITISSTVKIFKKEAYDYDATQNVKSYKISLTVSVLIEGKGLKKAIYNGEISDWITEDATTFDLEKAKEDVSKKVSDDIIEKIFSYW